MSTMPLDNPRQQETWRAPLGELTQFAPTPPSPVAICVIVRDWGRFLAYDLVPDFLYSSTAFCLNPAVYLGDGVPIVPPFPAVGHHAETENRFSTDLGQIQIHSEFANSGMDELLEAFGIRRPLSRKGNPYDNAVIESTNKILKRGLIYRRAFAGLDQLRRELNSYVRWYNEERIHSTLGYMSPVEFRKAGLSL